MIDPRVDIRHPVRHCHWCPLMKLILPVTSDANVGSMFNFSFPFETSKTFVRHPSAGESSSHFFGLSPSLHLNSVAVCALEDCNEMLCTKYKNRTERERKAAKMQKNHEMNTIPPDGEWAGKWKSLWLWRYAKETNARTRMNFMLTFYLFAFA